VVPRAPRPDPRTMPWPLYASAVIELILAEDHLVLTPVPSPADAHGGEAFAELAAVLGEGPVWVLTAGDPYPVELSDEENQARGTALRERLDALGLVHAPALGRSVDGSTAEESVAVGGVGRATILRVAAAFDQLAVYAIDRSITCIDVASASDVTVRAYRLERATRASGALVGPTGWTG